MLTVKFYELENGQWNFKEKNEYKKYKNLKEKQYEIFFKYFDESEGSFYKATTFKELFKVFANYEDWTENGEIYSRWLKLQNLNNERIFLYELTKCLKYYKIATLSILE